MELGRKIYWDSITGGVIVNRLEMHGDVRESTVEEDFRVFVQLAERNPETVTGILLDYGKYSQDFAESVSYKIIETSEPVPGITTLIGEKHYDLIFVYPDPNDPDPQEPVYQQPLTEQVKALSERQDATEAAILALMDVTVMG